MYGSVGNSIVVNSLMRWPVIAGSIAVAAVTATVIKPDPVVEPQVAQTEMVFDAPAAGPSAPASAASQPTVAPKKKKIKG